MRGNMQESTYYIAVARFCTNRWLFLQKQDGSINREKSSMGIGTWRKKKGKKGVLMFRLIAQEGECLIM